MSQLSENGLKKTRTICRTTKKYFVPKIFSPFLVGFLKCLYNVGPLICWNHRMWNNFPQKRFPMKVKVWGKDIALPLPDFQEGKESSSPHLSANVLTCCNSVCIMFPGSFFLCYGENNAEDAHPDLPIQGAQGRQVCMQCASTQLPLF